MTKSFNEQVNIIKFKKKNNLLKGRTSNVDGKNE